MVARFNLPLNESVSIFFFLHSLEAGKLNKAEEKLMLLDERDTTSRHFRVFFFEEKKFKKEPVWTKRRTGVFFFFLRGSFIVVDTGPVFFPKKLCTNSSFPTGVSAKVEC